MNIPKWFVIRIFVFLIFSLLMFKPYSKNMAYHTGHQCISKQTDQDLQYACLGHKHSDE